MKEAGLEVPVLETNRLILRVHGPDDLDAYQALWLDPDVIRFTSRDPMNREQAWSRILLFRGMWATFGFGMWIVEDKKTGEVVGEAGLQDRCREIEPSLDGTVEAGWVLLPQMHGRGIAREAMEAVFSWGRKLIRASLCHASSIPLTIPRSSSRAGWDSWRSTAPPIMEAQR